MDNPGAKENLNNYIPCILITADDGFYLYYADTYVDSNGENNIGKRFTEKIPYAYEDNWFYYSFTLEDTVTIYDKENRLNNTDGITTYTISYHDALTEDIFEPLRTTFPECILLNEEEYELKKREVIVSLIEEHMSYYVNEYNKFAFHNGITYKFSMPMIDNSEWIRSMDSPSMLVIFQGYPIKGTTQTFNRFSIAQAVVNRKTALYVEEKGWYRVLHKLGCSVFSPTDETQTYYSLKEGAEHGCFTCEVCFPDR